MAIGNLCMKAWRAREKAQLESPHELQWLETPQFISQLRKQKEVKDAKIAEAKGAQTSQLNLVPQAEEMKLTPQSQPQSAARTTQTTSPDQRFPQLQQQQSQQSVDGSFGSTFSPDDFSVMDDMPMDWQRWDSLLNDFELPVQPLATTLNPSQLQFLGQYGQQGYSWPLPSYRAQ